MTINASHAFRPPENSSLEVTADFEALMPSILQCFSILLAGYVSRKIDLLNAAEVKGLRVVLVYFLAPALMVKSLMEVQWQSVNWKFLACGFVAKSLVFVFVAAVTLCLSNNFGKAGLFAIFATQSNDLAFGYPIAKALYFSTEHADYPRYIYLLMPVSLLILNPIGFFMLELDKQKNSQNNGRLGELVFGVFGRVLVNPMVFSTIVGLAANIFFQHVTLPQVIPVVLEGFSSGFVSIALFTLGCTLVINEQADSSHCPIATALLLTLSKILLLPLILTGLIFMTKIGTSAEDTSSLGLFGFLYGSIPTAPTVFVFASLFDLATGQIAISLALCTFLSAPWLYVSSRMISIKHIKAAQRAQVLKFTNLDSSIFGLISSIICLIVFVIYGKSKQLPQRFVFCVLIWSVLINFVALQLFALPESLTYFSFCKLIFFAGQWGCKIFTIMTAISLYMLKRISLCRLIKYTNFMTIFGFVTPILLACMALFLILPYMGGPKLLEVLEIKMAFISLFVNILTVACSASLSISAYMAKNSSFDSAYSLLDPADSAPSLESDSLIHRLPGIQRSTDDATEKISQSAQLLEDPSAEIAQSTDETDRTSTIKSNSKFFDQQRTGLVTKPPSVDRKLHHSNNDDRLSSATKPPIGDIEDSARLLAMCQDADDDEERVSAASTSTINRKSRGTAVAATCPAWASCSVQQRYECKISLQKYKRCTHIKTQCESVEEPAELSNGDCILFSERDFTAHFIFIALQCVLAVLDSSVCLWALMDVDSTSGTFLQLKLLNSVLIYIPGAICLWLFGDCDAILVYMTSRLRRFVTQN